MITDVDGIEVGHWTDTTNVTGCTVVLLPADTVASGEVRGGAPATREFMLLDPTRLVNRVDAVVLTGGSALGLAAGDGVARWLHERGRGFPTTITAIPIVVAVALFDLATGAVAWPDAAAGYAAAGAARSGPHAVGLVGAGIGATVDKWRGLEHAQPGGIVARTERDGDLVVSAILAVNAHGQLDDGGDHSWPVDVVGGDRAFEAPLPPLTNTTIGVIATNARLDKLGCHWVAQGGHDGMARALVPSHARSDGDALVAVATGNSDESGVDAGVDHVRYLGALAVERAIRSLLAPE